jgi:hypothetical protein
MIAPESNHPDTPGPTPAVPARRTGGDDQPVTTLRGATVNVDIRRAGQVVVGVGLAALAVTGLILLIAGIHNNSQINRLRHHGVPVSVSVTTCLGLMGGTGQQGAGYSCTGTYTLDGTEYRQAIPGLAFHAPGSTIEGVAVPGDPKLLTTPDQLSRQHASWTAFIIPGLLLLVVAVALVVLLLRRSRSLSPAPDGTAPAAPR